MDDDDREGQNGVANNKIESSVILEALLPFLAFQCRQKIQILIFGKMQKIMMRILCRRRATRPGDTFDKQMTSTWREHIVKSGVNQNSAPFTAWIHQPSFQILALCFGIYSLITMSLSLSSMEPSNLSHLTLFRLLGDDRVLSIRFMHQGCLKASFTTVSSANRTWRLDRPLSADGFVLTFAAADVGGPPTRFSL